MRYFPWPSAIFSLLFVLLSTCAQAAALAPQAISLRIAPDNNHNALRAVTDVADGQAGYVHYFLITHLDGTLEDQVGIELEDQRIAWSFPGAGVIVSEFVKNGVLDIAGNIFFIEHLHGIRPFRTTSEMQVLRNDLPRRVAFWVDEETPYCIFRQPGEKLCLNCGDFVVRILFPAPNALMVALPEELTRAVDSTSTTDDLLIYMLGLHTLPDVKSRLERLRTLDLPETLRLDVLAMLQPDQVSTTAATIAGTVQGKKPVSRIATRRIQNKRL
jgi:hypothetical protein